MKIFFDVDTQNDFMNKDGALYVPNAELIIPNISDLRDFARYHGIQVLGSVDRHFGTKEYKNREGELKKWGGQFPDHCMDSTPGQLHIPESVVERNPSRKERDGEVAAYVTNLLDSASIFELVGWINRLQTTLKEISLKEISPALRNSNITPTPTYFEKQSIDVFDNRGADFILTELVKHGIYEDFQVEAVVYGVAADYCVKAAVLGMQKRGIQCHVVEDAIKGITPEGEKPALEEMLDNGAKLMTTAEVLAGRW